MTQVKLFRTYTYVRIPNRWRDLALRLGFTVMEETHDVTSKFNDSEADRG